MFEIFLSFLKKYEIKKFHNMFLMLNLRFKSLHLILFYIVHEENVVIIEEYNNKPVYPMLIKCYNHLHLVLEFAVGRANLMA
jgi:hypothetical protein